jgi:G:T-mismatch repair DNA endonuclease (very short patch repair protein)
MIDKIGAIKGLGDFAKIPKLTEPRSRPRKIQAEPITIRQRPVSRESEADVLEKAAKQGVVGTLPERIVWKWLEDHDYRFITQGAEFGGRMVLGGAVVDFVVYDIAGQPTAIRVMGDYWHGPKFPGRQARDDEHFMRLSQMGYLVVDLWEGDIYEAVKRDRLTAYIMGEVNA